MTRSGRTGLIVVVVVMAGLIGLGLLARRARQPESGSVLEIVLNDTMGEQPGGDAFLHVLGGKPLVLRDYIEAILQTIPASTASS